jgi:predicted ATPase
MVREFHIENFKSIQSLKMELGRFNVLIGANGCGKSNILEGIAMGCAAAENRLDNASLINRGIRLTEPALMKSGFDTEVGNKEIHIRFPHPDNDPISDIVIKLDNDVTPFSNWNNKTDDYISQTIERLVNKGLADISKKTKLSKLIKAKVKDRIKNTLRDMLVADFAIYSPENYFLRRFEDEEKGNVLGLRGEGLFLAVQTIANTNPEQFLEIKKHLKIFDWFEDAEIPKDLFATEKRLKITDNYLQDGLKYFDQKSANEGFLYVLFYLTLFISDYTPKFFAIDNIDNALNPKLAGDLMKILAALAEKHGKQVIFTTHNPAILDGLNLNDPEQRLFVVSRNAVGHTKALRIEKKPTPANGQSVKLSEQFLRGYIGGLNF